MKGTPSVFMKCDKIHLYCNLCFKKCTDMIIFKLPHASCEISYISTINYETFEEVRLICNNNELLK